MKIEYLKRCTSYYYFLESQHLTIEEIFYVLDHLTQFSSAALQVFFVIHRLQLGKQSSIVCEGETNYFVWLVTVDDVTYDGHVPSWPHEARV